MTDTGTKPAAIRLVSRIDGEETVYQYEGQYRCKDGSHTIVYTDYTGNTVTRVGIKADERAMLLHRAGAIRSDMYFDPLEDTMVDYDAVYVKHRFVLHTDEYRMIKEEKNLRIYTEYSLADQSGHPPIRGEQEMLISFREDR